MGGGMGAIRNFMDALLGRAGGPDEAELAASRAAQAHAIERFAQEYAESHDGSDHDAKDDSDTEEGANPSGDDEPFDMDRAVARMVERAAMCFDACRAGDEAKALRLLDLGMASALS